MVMKKTTKKNRTVEELGKVLCKVESAEEEFRSFVARIPKEEFWDGYYYGVMQEQIMQLSRMATMLNRWIVDKETE